MKKRILFLSLLALGIVQLAVPLSMIVKRESTLSEGRLFHFRTAPVDPYDAFRGRYVALTMEHSSIADPHARDYSPGQKIYLLLEEAEDGFARPIGLVASPPEEGAFVTAWVARWPRNPGSVTIRYPFDRYYMNEEKAPAAEKAYREFSSPQTHDTYVAVRIKDGFAVLEELYVSGQPILQFLADHPESY